MSRGRAVRALPVSIQRLLRRPEIRALSRLLAERGQPAWIVGGAPRDLLLGRIGTEVDVAVRGDAEGLAAQMERAGHGRSVAISSEPPRVFRIAGRREIDLVELEGGSIRADLGRRDYTVNAMAIELSSRRLIDPFDGLADLAAGRLRMIEAANLFDDPLRVLRAARLFATHELRPDRATSAACRKAASGLERVAPERIRSELWKLLEAERIAPALRWASRQGCLDHALGLERVRPERIRGGFARLDQPPLPRLAPRRRARIRLSWLLAGAGLSPDQIEPWLAGRRFSREEASQTARLLELARRARVAKSTREEWVWVRDARELAEDALALMLLLHPREQSRMRWLTRRARRPRPRLRVTGGDVMDWLEIAAGPAVGRMLRELEVEILRGAVRTRGQARRWIEGRRRFTL